MKKIIELKLIILLLFSTNQIFSQTLPSEWEGEWKGIVNIWSYNVKTDSFPMSLKITPRDSVLGFQITYIPSADKPDVREYELIIVDETKHHMAIDERNSIILDSYFNENCLYTKFGGMGSELLTRICLNEQVLEYEITSSNSEPIRISGNEVVGKDTIPEIRSYDLFHIMKAKLRK